MLKIDVCGLSCPEPVIKVKQAMSKGESQIEVVSDAACSVENITRLCNNRGYSVNRTKDGDIYNLVLTKK